MNPLTTSVRDLARACGVITTREAHQRCQALNPSPSMGQVRRVIQSLVASGFLIQQGNRRGASYRLAEYTAD